MEIAIGGVRVKKIIASIMAVLIFLSAVPVKGFASGLTLEAPSEIVNGSELVLTGTSPGSEVILHIQSDSGEILFFDTPTVTSGKYRAAITIPSSWPNGTYKITAISDTLVETKSLIIRSSGINPSPITNPVVPNTESPVAKGNTVMLEVATTVLNGRATAVVTMEQIKQVIAMMNDKVGSNRSELRIQVKTKADQLVLQLPSQVAGTLFERDLTMLVLDTTLGSISFDQKSIQTLRGAALKDLEFMIKQPNRSTLLPDVQRVLDGRPVIDLTVTAGKSLISNFGGGTVKASIPYTLGGKEDPNGVVIYYIADDGEMKVMPNGFYDQQSGRMTFGVKHLSQYGIGYNQIIFADVSGWSKDHITYLAARGIVYGTGENKFSPKNSITRAEMVAILARMSGEEIPAYKDSLFTDVHKDDWYASYIQWGHENGVALGVGNGLFNPKSLITREELAVMIYRYAQHANYSFPVVNEKKQFADSLKFSNWTTNEISVLQQAGIIHGKEGNKFDPKGNASREEAAKMIAVLVQGMSK